MKNGTNEGAPPPLIGGVIADQKHYIDNLFTDIWKTLKYNARIMAAGFTKRSEIYNGSRFSIAALEVDQCVVDSDVFRKSHRDVLAGEKRHDVTDFPKS